VDLFVLRVFGVLGFGSPTCSQKNSARDPRFPDYGDGVDWQAAGIAEGHRPAVEGRFGMVELFADLFFDRWQFESHQSFLDV